MWIERLMRTIRQAAGATLGATIALALGLILAVAVRSHPQDLPWTKLDLGQPIGMFTGRKLTGLTHAFPRCERLLRGAGVKFDVLPAISAEQCGYADGVRMTGGSQRISYSPKGLGTSCAVAAALSVWEWNVVQPAALKRFKSTVTAIDHYGSYNCRHIRGGSETGWSEHATADAVDIAAFHLADGTIVSVARDWSEGNRKAAFLRDVRNGACKTFSTVLSPDYNAEHHSHLHLDQAARGEFGWRACR
ncbi:extensin family protein [soil metagenome]